MNLLAIFESAKELIQDETSWTKGQNARNAEDFAVFPDSPDAVRWCARGALMRASGRTLTIPMHVIAIVQLVMGRRSDYQDLMNFNDNPDTTHKDILAVFDKFINQVKENERLEAAWQARSTV